jgi:hypothetical protein
MFFGVSFKKSFTHFSLILFVVAFGVCILPESTLAALRVNATPASATIDEDGAGQTFEIRLDEPIIAEIGDAYVTINLSVNDDRLTLSTSSIYFSASQWTETRELVVSANNDDIENGATAKTVTMLVDSNSEYYNNFQNTISITVIDDDEDSEVNPSVEFVSPTPVDDSYQLEDAIEINLTSSDENDGHYVVTDFNDSLIGWWRFENNSDDDSGVAEGSAWSDDGVGEGEDYGAGRFGQAAKFDGHSAFDVTLDDAVDTSFTLSAWVYLDALTEAAAIFSDENGHLLQIGGSSRWQFNDMYDAGVLATTSQWVHLVGVYDQSTGEEILYVDGEVALLGSEARTIGNVLHIGKRNDNIYLDGKIDEVMVFRRALGADEVSSLYDATETQYEHVFNELDLGGYSFTGYVVDKAGRKTTTGERIVTVTDILPVEDPVEIVTNRKGSKRVIFVPTIVPIETVRAIQTLTEDLHFGMTGEDVNVLQLFLVEEGKGPAAAALKANGTTNYFGPLTRASLAEWQKANGITPAVGYFGPLTRAFIFMMKP